MVINEEEYNNEEREREKNGNFVRWEMKFK